MMPSPLVVGLGQASLDFLGRIPSYPEPDSKCELQDLTIQGGGPAATAMVTLSRLGIRTAFIGAVGDDEFGPMIRQGLTLENVDCSGLAVRTGGRSQVAFIAIGPDASRTIFWHRGDTRLTAGEIDAGLIRSAGLLHTDGLHTEASLHAARIARQAGIPVVLDAGTLRDGYLELAALTDYLICSEKFFRTFHPDGGIQAGLKRLMEYGPRQVAVTLGSSGSCGFDGKTFHVQPAFQVRAADTTGAGDVYHGAYIFGILAGWDMAACMRLASAAAAMTCGHIGGRTGIPDLKAIRAFMKDGYPG